MLTDNDIKSAIETCQWRQDVGGTWICGGDIVPCLKHIDDGKCDTLKKLFEIDDAIQRQRRER